MIEQFSVRNYQSLHHVDLSLGPLTVIVGPSSSGKSALTRALKTLAFNTRGNAFISSWATRTSLSAVIAHGSTRFQISLVRSKKSADDAYTITPSADSQDHETYTKLAGTVPPEVSSALGIFPDSAALHFASQFDKPYLLDESPATIAQALASLTNVSTVFEAARQANRTRLATNSTLKTRKADLAQVTTQAEALRPVAAQRRALDAAQSAYEGALDTEQRIARLRAAARLLSDSTARLLAARTILDRPQVDLGDVEALFARITSFKRRVDRLNSATSALDLIHVPSSPPSTDHLMEMGARLTSYRGTLLRLKDAGLALKARATALDSANKNLDAATSAHLAALQEAGTCPTCGQSTHSLKEMAHA